MTQVYYTPELLTGPGMFVTLEDMLPSKLGRIFFVGVSSVFVLLFLYTVSRIKPATIYAARAVSSSKLGMFFLAVNQDSYQMIAGCPKFIKVYDPQRIPPHMDLIRKYKYWCSGGQVIVRIGNGTHDRHYTTAGNPEAAAADYWSKLKTELDVMSPSDRALVDYVAGPNEDDHTPHLGADSSAYSWMNTFWTSLAHHIKNAGFRPLIGETGLFVDGGSIDLNHLPRLAGALNTVRDLGGAWSVHPYTDTFRNDVAAERHASLWYRPVHDKLEEIGVHGVPMIFGEGGIGVNGGQDTGGWKAHTSAAGYQSWLAWWDGQMRADSYVLGSTLFQAGAADSWRSFNIDTLTCWFRDYLGGGVCGTLPGFPVPTGSGPPEPTAGPRDCAKPGTPQILNGNGVMPPGKQPLRWTAAPHAAYYAFRLNDHIDDWTGSCLNPNYNDRCTNVSGTEFQYTLQHNHTYNWWVQGVNDCGQLGDAVGGNITISGSTGLFPSATPIVTRPPAATPLPTLPFPTTPALPSITSSSCNVDVVMVIDDSGSMRWKDRAGIAKIDYARMAGFNMINAFKTAGAASPNIRMALVSVKDYAKAFAPLTNPSSGYDTLIAAFNRLNARTITGPATCIACGAKLANELLSAPDRQRFIIFITDGGANVDLDHNRYGHGDNFDFNRWDLRHLIKEILEQTTYSKTELKSLIFVISESHQRAGINPEEDVFVMMQNMSSGPAYFHGNLAASQWLEQFKRITTLICPAAGNGGGSGPSVTPGSGNGTEEEPELPPVPADIPFMGVKLGQFSQEQGYNFWLKVVLQLFGL